MARDFHPNRTDPRGLQKNQRALEALLERLFALDGEELFVVLAGKSGGQAILLGLTVDGGLTADAVGVGGSVPGAVIGGQVTTFASTGYAGVGGIRMNGADAINSIWNTIPGAQLAITTNNGRLVLGAGISVEHLAIETNGRITLGPGSPRFIGRTATAANPTTTELPADKDFGLHKNTSSGAVFLAYNDGGAIKKVALT